MKTAGRAFLDGVTAVLPVQLGVIPFALIAGVSAVAVGLTPVQGAGMSLIVFAGAAQLVALQLMALDTPAFVIFISTFFINLRFLMYSASIGPYFQQLPARWKWLNGYLLTDQAYALSILEFNRTPEMAHKRFYYLGAGLMLWVTWQTGTIVGVLVGAQIPAGWSLDFAVPLTFMALVFPALPDRPSVLAALSAGGTAVLGASLPYNMGLILAALVGIGVGMAAQNRRR